MSQPLQLDIAATPQVRWLRQFRSWTIRHWIVAFAAALAVALATGVPTAMVPTSLFRRMTPVVWWNYPIWAVSAVLAGLVMATFVRSGNAPPSRNQTGGGFIGGLASSFAVGCPICNKLVVAMMGVGGAMNYFAPIQPVLGVFGIALLAATLVVRLRRLTDCSTPVPKRRRAIPSSRSS